MTARHYKTEGERPLTRKGEPWCLDGQHELYKPPRGGQKRCKHCGTYQITLRGAPKAACKGEFRVVCTEPGCDYAQDHHRAGHVDADGNGYTNHTMICLAKAALIDHQNEVLARGEDKHAAFIQQHPVRAIAGDEVDA